MCRVQGVCVVIRAILHYSEVCYKEGRTSISHEGVTGQGQCGKDGWVAGAREGAEAKRKVPELASVPEDDWRRNC